MGGYVGRMGDDKLAEVIGPERGGEKQERKTETALREIWKGWEENGEQQHKIGDGECC